MRVYLIVCVYRGIVDKTEAFSNPQSREKRLTEILKEKGFANLQEYHDKGPSDEDIVLDEPEIAE